MKIIPVPEDLYLDVLNYLESCCETERHNPDDPCHALLDRLNTAGEQDENPNSAIALFNQE